jgi:hypothetical protein
LFDALEILEKGGKLSDMSKESQANLKQAFTTEGKMVSELFKTRRDLYTSMSNIGVGLMAILVSLIAACVLGLKMMQTDFGGSNKMFYANLQIFRNMADGWDLVLKGKDGVVTAMGKEFGDTFAPMIEGMRWNYKDPPPPPVRKNVPNSWDSVFGDPKAAEEEQMRREEELLKGTGLIGPAKPTFKLVSPQGLIASKIVDVVADALVVHKINADDPKARERQYSPSVDASSGPVVDPSEPPVSVDDLGFSMLQSQVEQTPGFSPRMGAK